MFLELASRRWWTLVVRGLLVIAFGIFTIMLPRAAVLTLVVIFGVYALAEGLTSLSMFLGPAAAKGGWLLGLNGVVSIAAGIVALGWPGLTAVALFYVIATWAIVIGAIELIAAIRYSDELESEWAFVLSGLLWIAFGVIVIGWPGIGVVAILALIATSAIIRGIMLIFAGAQLKSLRKKLEGSGTGRLGART